MSKQDRDDQEGVWVDDHTFVPSDVFEKGMAEAEGKILPLKDRPGGEVIGTATVRNGHLEMTVTDPAAKKMVDELTKFPLTGKAIGMTEDWGNSNNGKGV